MSYLMPEITDGRIDGYPVANATLDDLDMSKLLAHIRTALASERCEGSPDRPDEFLLRYRAAVRVSDQIRPTMAGIMMFGIRPQYFFPHADVGLGHFPGTVPNTIDVFHLARH